MIAATGGVPEADQGLASGVVSTAQELGTAIGLAGLASIATVVIRAHDHPEVADASTAGYRAGFLAAAALMAVAVAVALRAPRQAAETPPTNDEAVAVAVPDTGPTPSLTA